MRWRLVADTRVSPLAVVEDLDEFEGRSSDLTAGGEPGSVHEFGFERTEGALHRGIVEAITLTAHGDFDVMGMSSWTPSVTAHFRALRSPQGIFSIVLVSRRLH